MNRTTRNRASGKVGFSLAEVLMAAMILAIAGVPLYDLVSASARGAERTRDHLVAYAIAEQLQEQFNQMLHDAATRKTAVDFEQPAPAPLLEIPFLAPLRKSVETALAALPGAATGDAEQSLAALAGFRYSVTSKLEKPAGAPDAIWLSKKITVLWNDSRDHERSVALTATFTTPELYWQVVKDGYRNSLSVTDQIMRNILERRQQPLVTYDRSNLEKELRAPLRSNEFLDPDPWTSGYLAQDARLTVRRRLGTAGQTSDERMAVKEAALAQFFGYTADQARVRTYDLRNEAEQIVKRVEQLPRYSADFASLKGVEGVGVRPPGRPGAYACLNCHAPHFFATLDEGYLSIPKEYLAFRGPDGTTGKQQLADYLKLLEKNKAITPAELRRFSANLENPDCGTCAGAASQ